MQRHASYAWALQDILGAACLLSALEVIRLPNFKVGTVLLCMFFVYDIFFVFITPYLTPNHDSVMVTAATGGSGATESIPLVFRIPRFQAVPCYRGESMLGFGDIVIPGIAVSHALSFDIDRMHHALKLGNVVQRGIWRRYSFFITALVSYTVGLSLTYIGMSLMSTAQPALMYLSPCLLLGLWGRAWLLGCGTNLWRGSPPHTAAKDDEEAQLGDGGDSNGDESPSALAKNIERRRSSRSPSESSSRHALE